AVVAFLAAIGIHPGAAALAVARVGIEVPQPDVLAGRAVLYFPDPNIRVIDRHALDRLERESEQLAGHPEHSLAQLLELHVRLDLILIERVFGLAHLFGVEAIIPGLDANASALAVGDGLHVGHFLAHARHRRRPHLLHERNRALRSLGHGI